MPVKTADKGNLSTFRPKGLEPAKAAPVKLNNPRVPVPTPTSTPQAPKK